MPEAPRPILKASPPFPHPNASPKSQSDYFDTTQTLTSSTSDTPLPFASASRIPPLESPHVHFPPTPIMTQMETTHSRSSYDRKSIVVSPNMCVLPGRGERDIGTLEDFTEGYFRLLPSSQNVELQEETSRSFSPAYGTSGSGSRLVSSSSATGTVRTLSDPLPPSPQALAQKPSRNLLRRHTDPYPLAPPLAVPPLIFDHSSEESDSEDLCSSPPAADPLQASGIPHISTHFPGGMSMGVMEPGSFLEPKTEAKMKNRNERWWHSQSDSDLVGLGRVSDAEWTSVEPDSDAVGLMPRARTSTRKIRDGTARKIHTSGNVGGDGFSSFSEPALDGCLGGF